MKIELLVATGNAGKVRELENLLRGLPIELRSLKDFPDAPPPEETGATFAENARLKAAYYARRTDLWALADDSGLETEALGGAPGVYSARFAGAAATDEENTGMLLKRLRESESGSRRARFVCAMALAAPSGAIRFEAEGFCRGEIVETPRGANGFGYDPVFVPEGFAETFAELSAAEKQRVSHRARATREIIRFLRDFINL